MKFSRFLFSTTDSKYWLISERENTIGRQYDLSLKEVLQSSESKTPTDINWVRNPTDGIWISINGHDAPQKLTIYAENSSTEDN